MEWTSSTVLALRHALRMGQEEFAEYLGASVRTVQNWERGIHRPIPRHQGALDTALDRLTPTQRRNFEEFVATDDAIQQRQEAELETHPASADAEVSAVTGSPMDVTLAGTPGRQPARPNRELHLTLVGGFAGSGKTEFGKFLSGMTGWAMLDKDALTRPLVESLLLSIGCDPNDRHTLLYRERVRPLEYRCLVNTALDNLECGISTVLTAPFLLEMTDQPWLHSLMNTCLAKRATVSVVWVEADVDSMYTYVKFRNASRDAWKLTNWQDYLASIDLAMRPLGSHVLVDNRIEARASLAEQAHKLTRRLEL